MDETGGHYAKWNKPEKDKYCMVSLTYEMLKKKKRIGTTQKQRAGKWLPGDMGQAEEAIGRG